MASTDYNVEMKSVGIAEFFSKNKQFLGFTSPKRALLTAIKEAVDNSLDSAEDADILPCISVTVTPLHDDIVEVIVQDNGPGIKEEHIPDVFGKMLFGSRFFAGISKRGQQGLGISAAVMYAYLSSGEPIEVTSRHVSEQTGVKLLLTPHIPTNSATIIQREDCARESGITVRLRLIGQLTEGPWSPRAYLEQVAIVNPHAELSYNVAGAEPLVFKRMINVMPTKPTHVNPHPHGLEFGALISMLHSSTSTVLKFLKTELSGVNTRAVSICKATGISSRAKTGALSGDEIHKLHTALQNADLAAPPMSCISPIGSEGICLGLSRLTDTECSIADTRSPSVYSGTPFTVETGLAYTGSDIAGVLFRYANRVPLLYQPGSCVMTEAAKEINWKAYGLSQTNGLPNGLFLLAHVTSPRVPFQSESKDSVANFSTILHELKLSFQACGRQLKTVLDKEKREQDEVSKKKYIKQFVPHVSAALGEILTLDEKHVTATENSLYDLLGLKNE